MQAAPTLVGSGVQRRRGTGSGWRSRGPAPGPPASQSCAGPGQQACYARPAHLPGSAVPSPGLPAPALLRPSSPGLLSPTCGGSQGRASGLPMAQTSQGSGGCPLARGPTRLVTRFKRREISVWWSVAFSESTVLLLFSQQLSPEAAGDLRAGRRCPRARRPRLGAWSPPSPVPSPG